jgi:hypothetical protein
VSLTCPRPVWGSVRIDLSGTTATLHLHSLPTDLLERILTLLPTSGSGTSDPDPEQDSSASEATATMR